MALVQGPCEIAVRCCLQAPEGWAGIKNLPPRWLAPTAAEWCQLLEVGSVSVPMGIPMCLEYPPKMAMASLRMSGPRGGARWKLHPPMVQAKTFIAALPFVMGVTKMAHIDGDTNSKGRISKPPLVLAGSGDEVENRTQAWPCPHPAGRQMVIQ